MFDTLSQDYVPKFLSKILLISFLSNYSLELDFLPKLDDQELTGNVTKNWLTKSLKTIIPNDRTIHLLQNQCVCVCLIEKQEMEKIFKKEADKEHLEKREQLAKKELEISEKTREK